MYSSNNVVCMIFIKLLLPIMGIDQAILVQFKILFVTADVIILFLIAHIVERLELLIYAGPVLNKVSLVLLPVRYSFRLNKSSV